MSALDMPARLLARSPIADGYYWARHIDGSKFIVLLEDGDWFTVGVAAPIDFDPTTIICRAVKPEN